MEGKAVDSESRHSFAVAGQTFESRGGPGPGVAIAHVWGSAQGGASAGIGHSFSVQGAPGNELLCSVRETGPGVYEVKAVDGAPLARITRRPGRKLLGPRRVRWVMQVGDGALTLTGKVGSWPMWLSYVVLSPVWIPFLFFISLYSLFEGSTDDFSMKGPSGTRWRLPGSGTALEYRGIDKVYHLKTQRLDFRVAYAQAVLHSQDRI